MCGCGGSGSQVTTYEYDWSLNLTKKTDALRRVSEFTYNGNGNLLTTTDALNNVTTITYPATNNKGLPEKVKDARLNETKLKWFSGSGLLQEIEDANGKKRISLTMRGDELKPLRML